ncbi:hypothetical protein [Aquimarina aggregata]|uniref:hypothetical protein n=1 Tax=Aquimarina aggregata TaxID=1642818 RepID=UPI002492614F|nr:hypothetical protein [Aquimarina aggregata]
MELNFVFDRIANNVKQIGELGDIEIKCSDILCLLGLDSVGRAELIEKTLEDFDIQADRFYFHSANNLGELAKLFVEKINENLNEAT